MLNTVVILFKHFYTSLRFASDHAGHLNQEILVLKLSKVQSGIWLVREFGRSLWKIPNSRTMLELMDPRLENSDVAVFPLSAKPCQTFHESSYWSDSNTESYCRVPKIFILENIMGIYFSTSLATYSLTSH